MERSWFCFYQANCPCAFFPTLLAWMCLSHQFAISFSQLERARKQSMRRCCMSSWTQVLRAMVLNYHAHFMHPSTMSTPSSTDMDMGGFQPSSPPPFSTSMPKRPAALHQTGSSSKRARHDVGSATDDSQLTAAAAAIAMSTAATAKSVHLKAASQCAPGSTSRPQNPERI
ncbi:hypothetical protein BCR44DRAFT_308921 [Catenaria anguillulae PL171]|uniref:Uncharacterized protein n=1 Tax=Catenaria anguillulae PL171 TaxID=765915 RepID=A0A1Y2HUS3_9FUNG|nr:hypothetical protein BCR44DRAFT_308921 [Catenaria anguillulae PL171]